MSNQLLGWIIVIGGIAIAIASYFVGSALGDRLAKRYQKKPFSWPHRILYACSAGVLVLVALLGGFGTRTGAEGELSIGATYAIIYASAFFLGPTIHNAVKFKWSGIPFSLFEYLCGFCTFLLFWWYLITAFGKSAASVAVERTMRCPYCGDSVWGNTCKGSPIDKSQYDQYCSANYFTCMWYS